jgi:hypothetical protein
LPPLLGSLRIHNPIIPRAFFLEESLFDPLRPSAHTPLLRVGLHLKTARAVEGPRKAGISSHAGGAQSVSRARTDPIRIRAKSPGVRHPYPTCHSTNPNYLFTATLLIQPLAPFLHSQ